MINLRTVLFLYRPALFCCLGMLALPASSIAQESKTGLPYTISKQTTHFTGPLKDNGDLDFFAITNDRHGKALTLESNAAVVLLPILDLEGYPLAPMLARAGLEDADIDHRPINPLPENLNEDFEKATKSSWSAAEYPGLADWVESNSFALESIRKAGKRPLYHVRFPASEGMVAFCL